MNSRAEILYAYCTFPSQAVAEEICARMVAERVVACANLIGPIKSIYEWKGQLVNEEEWAALLKTSALKREALKERIRAIHPYEVPSLVFWSIEDGLSPFLKWVYSQSL